MTREVSLGEDGGSIPMLSAGVFSSHALDETIPMRQFRADVDEEPKGTRLQKLKDQLVVSDDPEAEVVRQEVE